MKLTYLCFTEIAAAGCFLDTRLQKRVFVETKSTEIILTGSCLFVCLAVAEEGG